MTNKILSPEAEKSLGELKKFTEESEQVKKLDEATRKKLTTLLGDTLNGVKETPKPPEPEKKLEAAPHPPEPHGHQAPHADPRAQENAVVEHAETQMIDAPYPRFMHRTTSYPAMAGLVAAGTALGPYLQSLALPTIGEGLATTASTIGVDTALSTIAGWPGVSHVLGAMDSVPILSKFTGFLGPYMPSIVTAAGGILALGKMRNLFRRHILGREEESTKLSLRANFAEGLRTFLDPFRAVGWSAAKLWQGITKAPAFVKNVVIPGAAGVAGGIGGLLFTTGAGTAYGAGTILGATALGAAGGLLAVPLLYKSLAWLASKVKGGGGGGGGGGAANPHD